MAAIRYALILALVFLPASPFATTFPVTKTADTNDSTCDSDCSLREAIGAANTNPGADDVPVPAGTYLLTLGQLVVSDDVSIAGVGQANTIIDGNGTDRVFDIRAASGVVAISGVTIQNGYAYHSGGGIRSRADLSLTNSTVSWNTAGTFAGGIYNDGTLALTYSTVSGNSGALGGGIFNSGGDAGIFNASGDVSTPHSYATTLTNSTVSWNTASQLGGGILNFGYLTVSNSTVSLNHSSQGGGINSRGLYTFATLTNSTVSQNSVAAGGRGGGLYEGGGSDGIALTNTIVADNGGDNCSGGISSLGHNLTDDTSCGFTEPSDLIVADAMLGPLQDNGGPTETHDLLPGSPAFGAGSPDCPPPATDQRGVARPQGAACDIGAVEYLPEPRSSLALIVGAGFVGFLYRRRST